MLFQNARLILPDRILPGSLRIKDGKIAGIGRVLPELGETIVDLGGLYLSAGFIDIHIHGAMRRDTMEASADAYDAITAHHAKGGTTSLTLTTVVATAEDLHRVLDAAEEYRKRKPVGARVLGVHLEGPYFSPAKPGAHWPHLIRNPDPAEYLPLIDRKSLVTQMTVAPELPGALSLISALAERGIIASGGHSDAWDEDAAAGFAHGMRHVTHTYNCMSSQRRRGPYRVAGLLEFAMGEPEITCELIADGHHVSPTLMRALYQAKGPDGIALITDAAGGAGLAEGEQYPLGTLPAVVRDGVGMLTDGSALASSTCGMIDGVRNLTQMVDISLPEAVRMATLTPARALGIEAQKGQLKIGADADLVILDDAFTVRETIVGGDTVYRRG